MGAPVLVGAADHPSAGTVTFVNRRRVPTDRSVQYLWRLCQICLGKYAADMSLSCNPQRLKAGSAKVHRHVCTYKDEIRYLRHIRAASSAQRGVASYGTRRRASYIDTFHTSVLGRRSHLLDSRPRLEGDPLVRGPATFSVLSTWASFLL